MKTGSNLICPISVKEIAFEIKNLSTEKTPGQDGLITKYNQTCK